MELKARVVRAMCLELEQRAATWPDKNVQTVYFGGGTPSLLDETELGLLMQKIRETYTVAPDAEVTLEANPDDITDGNLAAWKKNGINRLSIGIQSFYDRDLHYMERIHTASEAESAIRRAQAAGITNLTIDLIYGTPGLTAEEWKHNLQKAVELGIPHISAYALTVEEGTPLFHRIRKKQKKAPDEDLQADQFLFMSEFLESRGFGHYEVSNLARPGMESRHNSSYWQGVPYMGIGPSAHSYDGRNRRMNVSNNARYVSAFEREAVPYFEEEILTDTDRYNEYLLTRLRTRGGLDREDFEKRYSTGEWVAVLDELSELPEAFLSVTETGVGLSREGMLHADGIAAELFR